MELTTKELNYGLSTSSLLVIQTQKEGQVSAFLHQLYKNVH